MKIYLFLQTKLLMFTIPGRVSGSFSFDENEEDEEKLINIEAKDGKWYLCSRPNASVIEAGGIKDEMPLIANRYYIIRKNEKDYLIYITDMVDKTFKSYTYSEDINLTIGNSEDCSLKFTCPYINGIVTKIYMKENRLLLNINNSIIYLNDIALNNPEMTYTLNVGDVLNIYGLKIIFLNGFILLNNPQNNLVIKNELSHLTEYKIIDPVKPQEIEIKDVDLYTKEQYFSKSPRIRRQIKTKEISLTSPPKTDGNNKMPAILTVGPMLTMGVSSVIMVVNSISKISNGTATMESSWPTLITSITMLISTLLWPSLTKIFDKRLKKKTEKETLEKYTKYLEEKEQELFAEYKLEEEILKENLLTIDQCLNIINVGKINFWDKRIDQNDFLEVRLGIGNEKLDANINYPEEGFTIEENALRKKTDEMVEKYKYIQNVPVGYSLYESNITALMGDVNKCYGLINNIILQLITYYSYDDIKIAVFTNNEHEARWRYIKYLNHSFSNDKSIRFFSTNIDEAKYLNDYFSQEYQNKTNEFNQKKEITKPYYIIITDDYSQIKNLTFNKLITEADTNYGFSMIILENKMSKLPSKCNNFINLGPSSSGILRNSFEEQETQNFYDEIVYNVDMMNIARKISNIPVELEEATAHLPDSVTFLEMEKVGKVEQLNIINRWDTNDSTKSLKAEVGLDAEGNLMYLDLHEKYHGPHGLIAGMTGSGKSEFIITYILSMAMNYSPDDVAFILIDYKGGGLAGAFENNTTGVYLPHLAGTITNLDKAEMDRTLVSIDSEVKRRQKVFNEARDSLGESTIDIYKYQRFYKEGRLTEPVPHLFIICDEFAELKSQQPDFMDNLISVARIGRSLGVHLILATQKPSGVVNDQIWSNTKFRVCLKVQDASDSREMLKRDDAAGLKQVGRFYLQVGYNEYFALGQSAWCGAKYFPSETIVKKVDKSISFIDDTGNIIKSIQAGNNTKVEQQGEQLAAVLNGIIDASKTTNKKVKRLWLNAIEPIILIDNLKKKYNFEPKEYDIETIIGEYDAPERQEQGLLTYSTNKDGNTIVCGNEEIEREKFLEAIIYSTVEDHSAKEVYIYTIDYGSEQLRMFSNFPQIGGMVFNGEVEEYNNLMKLIKEEIKKRKKLLMPYGGSIDNYNNKNSEKLPTIMLIINNYDAIYETDPTIGDELSAIARECERYGIVIIITCSNTSVVGRKVRQSFNNAYVLHLNDPTEYRSIFNTRDNVKLRDIEGRGLVNNDGVHEFQTASIVENIETLNDAMFEMAKKYNNEVHALKIPTLPEKVTYDLIEKEISDIHNVPIGISKEKLKVVKHDFIQSTCTSITSAKLESIHGFIDSLLDVMLRIEGLTIIFIDTLKLLPDTINKTYNGRKINYYNDKLEEIFDKLIEFEKNKDNEKYQKLYIFYGIEKLNQKVSEDKIKDLTSTIKEHENSMIILCEKANSMKTIEYSEWYSKIKNSSEGIWIGKGFAEQSILKANRITKEMSVPIKNNYGYYLYEGEAELIKLIQFNDSLVEKEDDDDEE